MRWDVVISSPSMVVYPFFVLAEGLFTAVLRLCLKMGNLGDLTHFSCLLVLTVSSRGEGLCYVNSKAAIVGPT